jgi:hypothetical protein
MPTTTISGILNIGTGVIPDSILSNVTGTNTSFNINKKDIDFAVYGTGGNSLIYFDASTGRLGIGTGLPQTALQQRTSIFTSAPASINSPTTAIEPVFTFTEDHVIIESFEIDYISLENRKAITALVLWRQQPDSDIGIIRSAEIRMTGLADNGPLEQYDLSQFCATEDHAVKVGTYRVASRYYVTHTLRIRVAPSSFNATLIVGDVVRVRLRRETNVGTVSYHNHFYEVERIARAISGVISLDLIHFPVDSQNRSLVGLAVNAAVGNGYTVPTGRTDFTCDIAGRAVDNTSLPDVGETISPINDPPVETDPAELGNEPISVARMR